MSCVRCLLPCLAALICARIALGVSMEEELVVPVKLEADANQGAPDDDGKVLYRLDAFGQALTLELEPDRSFLAKGFSLQYVGRPKIVGEEIGDLTGCFYSGTVNGDRSSSAALSLCSGIRGAFFYKGEEYFIQPSNHTVTPASPNPATPLVLHLLSKRSRAKAKCGVTDSTPQELASEEPPKILTPPGTAPLTPIHRLTHHIGSIGHYFQGHFAAKTF